MRQEGGRLVATPRIFLNYRREDTRGYAGRLYDRLSSRFGKEHVFRDVDAIPPGIDYLEYVDRVVEQCDVMLVLVGETWISVKDARGNRRLDDPRDLVRLEIAAALERNIPVIPVLIQGAGMPTEEDLPDHIQSLARRNALEMSDSHWNYDWEQLTQAVDQLTSRPAPKARFKQPVNRDGQPTPEPTEPFDTATGDVPVSATTRPRWPIGRPLGVALVAVLPLALLLTAGYLVAHNARSPQGTPATSSNPTGTRATTTSHSMEANPSGATTPERQLLKYIPASMRQDCDRASKPLPGAVAAFQCIGNNMPTVQYNLFNSNDTMYRLFNGRVRWVGAHTGKCNLPTSTKHLDKVIQDGATVGSLLCYTRQGEARLEWTNKLIHVYTYSSSKSEDVHGMYHRLFMHAGPLS